MTNKLTVTRIREVLDISAHYYWTASDEERAFLRAEATRILAQEERQALRDALFVGIFPGGIVYCDRTKEEHGDYKKIAFLPYGSLKLEVYAPKSKLVPDIEKHAATIQAQRGQEFPVSQCGQTVLLGREG